MRLSAAVATALGDHGIDTMFGVMGEGNLRVVDHFAHELGRTYVASANEFGAVTMANGYAQASGRIGVATVTQGPGVTNTIGALTDCVRAGTPVIVLAGDTEDRQNKQYIEQARYLAPTGAGFVDVGSRHSVVYDVARAVDQARTERRPVVLNVRVEIQDDEVAYRPVDGDAGSAAPALSSDEVEAAVGIISAARRPLVLAGHGTARSNAKGDVLALAQRLGAPLATTLRAKDLFTADDGSIGICGSLSNPEAYGVIDRADCIISLGASLSKLTTDRGTLFRGKSVIECDIGSARIGANLDVDAGIVGDVAAVAQALVKYLDVADIQPTGFRQEAGRLVASGAHAPYRDTSTPGTVDIRTALSAVDQAVPRPRNLVVDVGRFMEEAVRRVHACEPGSFVYGASFGAVGIGMGAAIGASFATPDLPTLLVCGDGGFMMTGMTEFNTAVRYQRDLICVVLDDGCYGAEEVQFRDMGRSPDLTMFTWPSFDAVATALGGSGFTVGSVDDLNDIGTVIARRSGPLLIDIKISPDGVS